MSDEWVEPDLAEVVEPLDHTSNIIFLNRCQGGCTFTPGFEDSRTNHSGIINRTSSLSAWRHGDEAWSELVACVQAMYDPFDIVVTDQDPGTTEHWEAVVAGRPGEVGMSGSVGGVSPFACGIINNAVNFSYANIYSSVKDMCETVAQETAHSFGLEHEYFCEDPMTYLSGCGMKWFRDQVSECGEYSVRSCDCRPAPQTRECV